MHAQTTLLMVAMIAVNACTQLKTRYDFPEGTSLLVGSEVQQRVKTGTRGAGGEALLSRRAVQTLYANSPATVWLDDNGPTTLAFEMAETINEVEQHGLLPAEYHLANIEALFLALESPKSKPELIAKAADLELLLSDAFFLLGTHLAKGKVNPKAVNEGWSLSPSVPNLVATLRHAIAKKDVRGALENLAPQLEEYRALQKALASYRALADKASDQRVHQQRIKQLEVNLERWRWLPRDLGNKRIIVDITGFQLEVFEGAQSVLSMPIVVGSQKDDRETPVFSDKISQIVVHPRWKVPLKIAAKEYLPKLQKDPSYFTKRKFKVYQVDSGEKREVAFDAVDWSEVTEEDFSYSLEQQPGPSNALGTIKFLFPNPFAVYLHGTPEKHLFSREVRSFSHGCIRLERPMELARYLLKANAGWSNQKLARAVKSKEEYAFVLAEPVPIHLIYLTASIEKSTGAVQFRRDIYGWDRPVLVALQGKIPQFRVAE